MGYVDVDVADGARHSPGIIPPSPSGVRASYPDGPQLLLEPSGHPAVAPYREALAHDGIPLVQFAVDDGAAEHDRLVGLGVTFTQAPTDTGSAVVAVFDDTCGNLV